MFGIVSSTRTAARAAAASRTRLAAVLTVCTLAAASGACAEGGATGPSESGIEGAYRLTLFKGRTLPTVVATTAEYRIELVENTITLANRGTYSDAFRFRLTDRRNVSTMADTVFTGTFTRSGTALTLARRGGDVFAGTVERDQIRLNDLVYQKR